MRVILLLSCLLFALTQSDEDATEEIENFDDLFEDLEGTYRRHPNVQVQWKILESEDSFVPVGADVSVLISVANTGEEGELQITSIQCFLHAKHDFDHDCRCCYCSILCLWRSKRFYRYAEKVVEA